ncbi:hypothetical protein PA25_05170 [Pseudoalteromonas sp. A25]|uniref:dermatopontin-like protein n=1 Tax=Pseudoalteromonas sp. A25 TaxID=116092 RepID=UPI00129F9692|nr:dermatopontin-like protein [Pseudoalteromonas sp. A25]BBN80532.1 hypothetical protein PA25_05170 [Pseudoalteromonas sp. A25]
MKVRVLKNTAVLAVLLASSSVFANAVQNDSRLEYQTGNVIYAIPANQAENVDTIIDLIDSNNDVSPFGVTKVELEGSEVIHTGFADIKASGNLIALKPYNATDVNAPDETFRFTCPSNMFLQRVSSYHVNWAEDRRFSFECAKFKTASGSRVYRGSVRWSGFVNEPDQALNYTCRDGEFLVGMYSEHVQWAEDRRFKFACAAMRENSYLGTFLKPELCSEDGPSSLDRPWDLGTTRGALIGMKSEHVNWAEDRKTTVTYCLDANNDDW